MSFTQNPKSYSCRGPILGETWPIYIESFIHVTRCTVFCRANAARINTTRHYCIQTDGKFSALSLWPVMLIQVKITITGAQPQGAFVEYSVFECVRNSVIPWYLIFLLDCFLFTEHCWSRLQLVRIDFFRLAVRRRGCIHIQVSGRLASSATGATSWQRDNASPGARKIEKTLSHHMCIVYQCKRLKNTYIISHSRWLLCFPYKFQLQNAVPV